MFRLAHISDLHLGPLPDVRLRELFSKRITGYINWHRHRKAFHQISVLDQVMSELKSHEPNHLAITGDLVNIATKQEIENAKVWLETNCIASKTSFVPGNHDAYVPGAFGQTTKAWRDWICGGSTYLGQQFPYMKTVDDIAIIGFSTSNATLPLRATGTFTNFQAEAGEKLLKEAAEKGLFRIILIHHPPYPRATHRMKRMLGIKRFRKMLEASGAELILHGHTHLNTNYKLETSHSTIDVIGISSASQAAGDKKPVAGFNLFDIEKHEDGWSCNQRRYAVQTPNSPAGLIDENKLF